MNATKYFLKISGLITFVLILSLTSVKAQKPFPVNFNDTDLKVAKNDISNWDGKIIACTVEVLQVEKGPVDKPYYKVKLEEGGQFWIGGLVKSGYEKAGAQLRLLGYFSSIQKEDTLSLKFNQDGFHMLAFAVIDLVTKQMAMMPGTNIQVNEWKNGSVPKGKK